MASKDPAFPFYSQDFITGTMFFTNEQVGIYIRLLCAQHQHGGLIKKKFFLDTIGQNDVIKEKFVEAEDGFYNERLMAEMVKREKKSSNLSDNAKKRWMQKQSKSNAIASGLHMPIENEIEDVNTTNKSAEEIFKLTVSHIAEQKQFWLYCHKITNLSEPELRQKWAAFAELREVVEDFKTAKELKEHFINWIKKQPVATSNPLRNPVKKQLR